MDGIAEQLAHSGVASSTRRAYAHGWSRFKDFCRNLTLPECPASSHSIELFAASLFESGLQHSTILVYIAAVRHHHILQDAPDPTFSPRLSQLLDGITRLRHTGADSRLPNTTALLLQMRSQLYLASPNHTDQLMLWGAFTTAFHGFLRVSEYVAASPRRFDPTCTLLSKDCTLHQHQRELNIKRSKTHQHSAQLLTLPRIDSPTCPVTAFAAYCQARHHQRQDHLPAFAYTNGLYLTRRSVSEAIKRFLPAMEDRARFASHSLRIVAATSATATGRTEEEIRLFGCWRSVAYRQYVRPSDAHIVSIRSRITDH